MRELEVDFSIGRMSNLSFVNIASWVPEQVATWLRGLDDAIFPYVHFFLNSGINGKKLLGLTHHDLKRLNIIKVGHQELILEAIGMLSSLHYELESENIQSIALLIGCKARSLKNELKHRAIAQKSLANGNVVDYQRPSTIEVLSDISDIVTSIKNMVSWLDRPPFDGSDEYIKLRNNFVKHGIELLTCAQVEDLNQGEPKILSTCDNLSEECQRVIQTSRDPLIIQPASLELATIRKKPEDELGMHIQSSYNGTHTIGGVKPESAADLCGKIEEGDEVIQVNYQTVVGWQLTKLVNALKDNKKEVVLTLKKRPKHATLFGPQGQKRKIPKNLKQSTFPKAMRRKSQNSKKGPRPPLTELLSTMPEVPTEPLPESVPETDGDTDNDLDNDNVFGSNLVPPTFPLEEKHRRATVSGASPIVQRPSIRINELATGRPKSYTISSPSSDGSLGSPGSEVASPQNDNDPADTSNTENCAPTSQASQTVVAPLTDELQQKIEFTVTEANKSGGQFDSPKRRRAAEAASREIAGEGSRGSPLLVGLKRIDSAKRAEMAQQGKKTDEKTSPTEESPIETEKELEDSSSQGYTVKVIGGVSQKVPHRTDGKESASASPTSILRKKQRRPTGHHRRISCKDLGGGDCQGWLWKKKESGSGISLSSKWAKRWFVLKRNNIYYYKSQDDEKAHGFIHLPGFQVSPAPEIKSKKFAFKAHHSGTTFYFAAERQDDMGKWMNKLGLAAIVYDTANDRTPMAAFRRPSEQSVRDITAGYHSESDDEDTVSLLSTIPGSPAPSVFEMPGATCSDTTKNVEGVAQVKEKHRDELVTIMRDIRKSEIAIDGADVRSRRKSTLAQANKLKVRNSEEIEFSRKLAGLRRTLKDKENELKIVEELLQSVELTSSTLANFKEKYPHIVSAATGKMDSITIARDDSSSDESQL